MDGLDSYLIIFPIVCTSKHISAHMHNDDEHLALTHTRVRAMASAARVSDWVKDVLSGELDDTIRPASIVFIDDADKTVCWMD